jgi:hypothetical protein
MYPRLIRKNVSCFLTTSDILGNAQVCGRMERDRWFRRACHSVKLVSGYHIHWILSCSLKSSGPTVTKWQIAVFVMTLQSCLLLELLKRPRTVLSRDTLIFSRKFYSDDSISFWNRIWLPGHICVSVSSPPSVDFCYVYNLCKTSL